MPVKPSPGGTDILSVTERASILVFCLWVVLVLSIFALGLGNFIYSRIKFANFYLRSAMSFPLAKSAYYDALYQYKNDTSASFDSQKELIRERSKLFEEDSGFRYHFEDEGSRININTANSGMLKELPGMDEDLAKDVLASDRRPFKVKEEILLVEGMNKEKFNQFKDLITVYGDGKVNINTASEAVLKALGLEEELVGIIARYRRESSGPDREEATSDDGALVSTSDILSRLRDFESLTLAQEQQILSLMSLWTVKSLYFSLPIESKIKGKWQKGPEVIFCLEDGKILSWREGY
ncbi:MAG: hypothetical protein UV78_C0012G0002 [Parcubacteria group bacterium GW2011_GWA2_43_17]|nr:MAG: hypothetical protein UV78_C0012G0002 [Parcubacteria group bacterium GW2011_GWA2_43_17]KKT91593.1 MAG: hypothetical protein UW91_C0030G0003 [Parcubacteria group bacterium GW2011_GWF2_45_11]